MKKLQKGFTLIELMVVISIIGLLSSIVLVSVKGARDKSKATAFRASVDQFITALELYKNDNGVYPGEPGSNFGFYTIISSGGTRTDTVTPSGSFTNYDAYKQALKPYIADLPVPPSSVYIYYRHSLSMTPPLFKWCHGDAKTPPYIILVPSAQPGFSDWPYSGNTGNSNTSNTNFRCFSLK